MYNPTPPCFLETEPGPASFSHIQLIASLAASEDPREVWVGLGISLHPGGTVTSVEQGSMNKALPWALLFLTVCLSASN